MGIYEELQARGLIAQVTDEERIRNLINNGEATFYIGFDCTAADFEKGHVIIKKGKKVFHKVVLK